MPRTGQEISDQWLDQGTRVQIISEPWSCVEGGNVFFLAWHPDTDDGPYQYRAKFGDWRQCLA